MKYIAPAGWKYDDGRQSVTNMQIQVWRGDRLIKVVGVGTVADARTTLTELATQNPDCEFYVCRVNGVGWLRKAEDK